MVLRKVLQRIVSQDIAGDILRLGGVIERNTGEMVVFIGVVIRAEGHVLWRYLRYYPRGHHVIGMDGVEAHEIGEDLVLVLVHHAFLFAYVDHRQHLLARDRGVILVIGEETGDELYEPYKRIEQDDEDADGSCRETHQLAPIGSTQPLWDNL